MWSSFFRYVLIASVAFLIGHAINFANRPSDQDLLNPSLYLLLANYGTLHLISGSIVAVLSRMASVRILSKLYLSMATVGFGASILLLSPNKYGGFISS